MVFSVSPKYVKSRPAAPLAPAPDDVADAEGGDPIVVNGLRSDLRHLRGRLLQRVIAELDPGLQNDSRRVRRQIEELFNTALEGEEIPLPFERFAGHDPEALERTFLRAYAARYGEGVAYSDAGLELAGIRVDLVAPVHKPSIRPDDAAATDPDALAAARKGERDAWFDGWRRTPVYDHERLRSGARLAGPAIVESALTTVVLPPGADLTVDPYHHLRIRP